jgi:hypothetical protein
MGNSLGLKSFSISIKQLKVSVWGMKSRYRQGFFREHFEKKMGLSRQQKAGTGTATEALPVPVFCSTEKTVCLSLFFIISGTKPLTLSRIPVMFDIRLRMCPE